MVNVQTLAFPQFSLNLVNTSRNDRNGCETAILQGMLPTKGFEVAMTNVNPNVGGSFFAVYNAKGSSDVFISQVSQLLRPMHMLAYKSPRWAVIEIKLVRLVRADIVQVVVAQQLLVWWKRNVMSTRLRGRDQVFCALFGESQGSQGPKIDMEIVLKARDDLHPRRYKGV
jgi:hypothetical protein